MPGVPREVIEHHFAVCPQAHPVKQKTMKQAQEKQDFIVQEIEKLKKAKLIREVAHPTWIANPVVVPKANGSGHLCVDFTTLNKACPKDPYPLQRIDQIVDSTAGCDLLCFLDAFSGYHQIRMAREDEEKAAFITPCSVYLMRTSHLLIHPLYLQRNTYKDLSLELVPSNLTIRYFRFLELFLTYMRI
jgi:hypothetical protein